MRPVTNDTRRFPICFFLICLLLIPDPSSAEVHRNYTYSYFENGHPITLGAKRRKYTSAHNGTRENPDIIVQTGFYSLRFECDTGALSGFDPLDGGDYVSALTEDVTQFSAANLELSAYIGSDQYTCTSGITQDTANQYFRFIEGGQYVQRFDHTRLVFVSPQGDEIYGRLEITAWPDHVTFTLDFRGDPAVTRTSISLTTPAGTTHLEDNLSNKISMSVQPHLNEDTTALNPPTSIPSATMWNGANLTRSWDSEIGGLRLDLPTGGVNPSTNKKTVHEYTFTVNNPTNAPANIPLIFAPDRVRAATGTVMTLCHDDGRPTGIPVQVSKNWHGTAGSTPHAGRWLRGYTMVPLAAGASQTFRLKTIYGYWGNGTFGTVSHSSLSLIGWSNLYTWKWDEAALGAWGESMTYDISQHAGGAVCGDVRPTFTTPFNGATTHSWTENVGGADFLNYYNSSNVYQPAKRLKTCYRWPGPNMTEVLYSGVTADDKIRFTYRTRACGTMDYNRRFHSYKYEFLQDVINPRRLAFYQMSADYYFTSFFSDYYEGGATGLGSAKTTSPSGNGYNEASFPFTNRWLAINDTSAGADTPNANRGLISTGSKLNGLPLDLHMHPYSRTWGSTTTLFDLSSDSVRRSYSSGDVVEGEISFILPAKSPSVYWGSDSEFSNRITNSTQPWESVLDEFQYNHEVAVTMHQGTMIKNYPLEINCTATLTLADFTINSGGIGHLPVLLKNVPPSTKLTAQRYLNGAWTDLEDVQVNQHDYYQGYYDSSGKMNYTFSLKRPSTDLSESWRIRILGDLSPYELWKESSQNSTPQSADQDQDGIHLYLEYILNGNPEVSDHGILPDLSLDTNIYSFHRRSESTTDFSQIFQYSSDLVTWSELNITDNPPANVTIADLGNGIEKVSVQMDNHTKVFVRLKVTKTGDTSYLYSSNPGSF